MTVQSEAEEDQGFDNQLNSREEEEMDLLLFETKQYKKKWNYERPIVNDEYYQIPFVQLDDIIKRATYGARTLVQGPHKSGKTTILNTLNQSINDKYFTIVITFDSTIDLWNQIYLCLKKRCPEIPVIERDIEFIELFHQKNLDKYFDGKPVAILFDDFQFIQGADLEGEILTILKRSVEEHTCLHTVFAFGTPKLIGTGTNTKPLDEMKQNLFTFYDNILHVINIDPLAYYQVEPLLLKWAKDRGLQMDSDVCMEIYNSTGGYASLIGMVGQELDNSLPVIRIDNQGYIDDQIWYDIRSNVVNRLSKTPLFIKLYQDVCNRQSLGDLVNYLLSADRSNCPWGLNYESLILYSYGVLWRESYLGDKFYWTCPIIREIFVQVIMTDTCLKLEQRIEDSKVMRNKIKDKCQSLQEEMMDMESEKSSLLVEMMLMEDRLKKEMKGQNIRVQKSINQTHNSINSTNTKVD
ncbi:hypothetical protein DFA_00746 [Cavenderia fasciculata]|uniref:Uncharacterized protein n=1 Tax=Cavenderia fasciculata TaxID=261658 RepID=F4PTJ9_CACFS|nr:uncharacterized protein DFA_00746 [Cavenderia fasciculata]EGG20881.1 hypothetical protein DFA_00746 [Cavenderia fasciculata]|eukprot:XP_004358731.1 hypothetical protein DFA_00746 [Cavenderia fasciculata]